MEGGLEEGHPWRQRHKAAEVQMKNDDGPN